MAEPTLQQVFGSNASQTEFELVIKKSDLAAIGLSALVENTAEALFAAIIAHAQQTLSETSKESNPDQSVIIEDGLPSLTTREDTTYRQQLKSITFEKPDTQSNFDPDDY
ncbi:MAG: hypothetical protein ACFB2X_01440 [Rivularia sp. (in: cyanobacteria)]